MYKFQVNKEKFKQKVKEHYATYIIDGDITLMRCYEMLMVELNIKSLKTLYNFQNNKYSIQLLMKIIEVLQIKDIEEIFKEIE